MDGNDWSRVSFKPLLIEESSAYYSSPSTAAISPLSLRYNVSGPYIDYADIFLLTAHLPYGLLQRYLVFNFFNFFFFPLKFFFRSVQILFALMMKLSFFYNK